MERDIQFVVVLVAIAFVAIYFLVPLVLYATGAARKKVVTCPKTGRAAEIELEAARPELCADGPAPAHIKSCSAWRSDAPCDQECVSPGRH